MYVNVTTIIEHTNAAWAKCDEKWIPGDWADTALRPERANDFVAIEISRALCLSAMAGCSKCWWSTWRCADDRDLRLWRAPYRRNVRLLLA